MLQRVDEASVIIDGKAFSSIRTGLLVYLGIHRSDTDREAGWIRRKILQARVFPDAGGKMGVSVSESGGEILVVSQITLYGSLAGGNRPDMGENMAPGDARIFFESFVRKLAQESGLVVRQGQFGTLMDICSVNHGPVTLWVESSPEIFQPADIPGKMS